MIQQGVKTVASSVLGHYIPILPPQQPRGVTELSEGVVRIDMSSVSVCPVSTEPQLNR